MNKSSTNTYLPLFNKFFEELFVPSVRYAYRYVHDWQIAEDIAQDVFLALWAEKDVIDFDRPIKPYLYKAIYHKSLNHLNSALIRKRVNMEDSLDDLINQEILSYNQYDTILHNDLLKEINSCIDNLPSKCQKVFRLSRESNLKNKEISLLLDISEKTVEKHISTALSKIRSYLIRLDMMPVLVSIIIQNILK